MEPPISAEVFETTTSKYWFENGIMCIVTKKAEPPNLETHIKDIQEFKKQAGDKKICAIAEINHTSQSSKEVRDYNIKELPELFKAIAFVIRNPLMRMIANLYLGAMDISFPVKMFSDDVEAKEWLKTQL